MPEDANPPPVSPSSPAILALVADMIFESKIRGTAAAVGVSVQICRDAIRAGDQLHAAPAVIVDLELDSAMEFVRSARAVRPDLPILGFFSHVRADLARQAREWGVSKALPRSKFTESLPDLLRSLSNSTKNLNSSEGPAVYTRWGAKPPEPG